MKLIRVFESLDPIRGMLVRGLLDAEGLEVLAKGEGLGPYRTGPVILFVTEDASDRARELIAAAEDGSLALEPDELPSGSAEGLVVERSTD
ncbi:MAG TPA: hypothetical protein VFI35_02895 [Actinomycetota bacterium]|nr:hypothetical protein [Actinomycetota bacterium]